MNKPGYKTTEFWMTILSQLVAISAMVLGTYDPDSQVLEILGAITSVLSKLGYDVSRAAVKRAQLN